MNKIVAIGRRKASVARVYFSGAAAGEGKFLINNRKFEEYLPVDILRMAVLEPFDVLEIDPANYDIVVNANGGGIRGQAEAIRLGISRALVAEDENRKPALKAEKLMTRDSRVVERKKFGQKKARKKFQFSKR